METNYYLVHITAGHEFATPLVASQLFDQAECQAVTVGASRPEKVQAWILTSFGEYFNKSAQAKLAQLRKRCPHVAIKMMNGISRLKQFPALELMRLERRKLGKDAKVIYHCRAESAAFWAEKLKAYFPDDKIVLDVRGYWPAESVYRFGIEYPESAEGEYKTMYEHALRDLKRAITLADAVTTVSPALRQLLIDKAGAPTATTVVPCCVSGITDDARRKEIRMAWGVRDNEIVVVYSGTTAAYQHLEDLTIPFMLGLSKVRKEVRLAFFSSEINIIKGMLEKAGADTANIILQNYPQQEVAAALSACDAGILIRKPTIVNTVANPVKIAEYMSAGLPIIIERGVGGVDEKLYDQGLLKDISVACKDDHAIATAVASVAEWMNNGLADKRILIRAYVKQVYLWNSAIMVHRNTYQKLLSGH